MLNIIRACPEDISYITEISETVFSCEPDSAPEGFKDPDWYLRTSDTGYLFKIIFNGTLVGCFAVFKTGQFNFQLDRIFILPGYQGLGIGKKTLQYAVKRFPEARVWYSDVNPKWSKYSGFLTCCGFFETGFSKNSCTRYIKLLK